MEGEEGVEGQNSCLASLNFDFAVEVGSVNGRAKITLSPINY